jgi:hypothetical protein
VLLFAVTIVVGAAKVAVIMSRLHVILVWVIITVSVPIFQDEIRPVAALLMLFGIVILLLITKLVDQLADSVRGKSHCYENFGVVDLPLLKHDGHPG